MIINCKEWDKLPDGGLSQRRHIVMVDGKVIDLVWYVDTEQGCVKTYDVFGDRKVRFGSDPRANEVRDDPDVEGIDNREEPLSRTIRGKVELIPIQ